MTNLPNTHNTLPSSDIVRINNISSRDLGGEKYRWIRDQIWDLYDVNMGDMARHTSLSSPKGEKVEEIFDPATILFLVFRRRSRSSSLDRPVISSDSEAKILSANSIVDGRKAAHVPTETETEMLTATKQVIDTTAPIGLPDLHEQLDELIAFASTRLDEEDTIESLEEEGIPKIKVVYIYEIQVSSSFRGLGLGRFLLAQCEQLAKDYVGCQKVMLTCLKRNGSALRFYERLGYQPDEIDPTRYDLLERNSALRPVRRKKESQIDQDWAKRDPVEFGDEVLSGIKQKSKREQEDGMDYRILSKLSR